MSTKTMIALAAMLMVGVTSAAQAGSKDDAEKGGGYRVGPLGQIFDGANPVYHRSLRGNAGEAFAFAMPSNKKPGTSRRVR
jgi:hypothetical protein